ncbi:hypothetical protein SAMN04487947_1853 [Halogeometricum rufum]|uniref:DUF7409 domain-containing protein n=1 Tax=Halogeometricum rufum TaxID=553469 RepID=A0A1I6GZ71_9EURY|nr:helix-hairpin-helix domain-containing protein [Halogeometricum rufum]SFR47439.1 hypothetical protein SAMN04487947_1853 [Halogeometricum rufum]
MTQGADSEDGVDDHAEGDAVGESEDRERGGAEATSDVSWSAAAPTESDEEIPLPWTVVDEGDVEVEVPDEFEALRFVGPKTAAALRDSPIEVADLVRKRVSYRDLTERGVHPGVAAKIRREHSLSWSFDSESSDLSRRSSQVRGLDDEERAWVAASAGWAEEDESAETDGSGDARSAESAWQAESVEAEGADEQSPTDGESAWRSSATASSDDGPTRDGEAAWRAKAGDDEAAGSEAGDDEAAWRAKAGDDEAAGSEAGDDEAAGSEAGDDEAAGSEAAWRERATASPGTSDDDTGEASRASATDAEAAWREQSAPTPVTALEAVDDAYADRLADAGIRSIRRLATADPESVADALELDRRRVERWCEAARTALD